MGPVRQNPIQRTVRTAHLGVLMTVHNFSTQYSTEQFWSPHLPPDNHHRSDIVYRRKRWPSDCQTLIHIDRCHFGPVFFVVEIENSTLEFESRRFSCTNRPIYMTSCRHLTSLLMRHILSRVYVCRADKEKQQFSIEIDGLMTQLDSANKAKVT